MIINEKVAYLKGLIEGANFDTNTTEGKLISEIVNALELIAFDLEEHEESIDELGAYVDELDGDLAEAEAAIYGDEYEDDCCCDDDCDCDDDCCCGCEDDEDEEEYYPCLKACAQAPGGRRERPERPRPRADARRRQAAPASRRSPGAFAHAFSI